MKRFIFLLVAIACTLPALGMKKTPKEKEFVPVYAREFNFPGVFRINDDLYVGKVSDGFYLAMERVDKSTITKWWDYAFKQGEKSVEYKSIAHLSDGNLHFLDTIENHEEKLKKKNNPHELWIAYASRAKITGPAQMDPTTKTNNDIEMFMCVMSSPQALLTNHIGISRSVEAELDLKNTPPLRIKQPQQSVHLHSFAAKVMFMQNTNRAFMITRPLPIMQQIITQAMPQNTVWIGDNIYKKEILTDHFSPNKKSAERKALIETQYKNLFNYPPRIFFFNENEFTIPLHGVKKSLVITPRTPNYSWLYQQPLTPDPEEIECPYILVDLWALANVKPLMDKYE